jgi:hypothetical protein
LVQNRMATWMAPDLKVGRRRTWRLDGALPRWRSGMRRRDGVGLAVLRCRSSWWPKEKGAGLGSGRRKRDGGDLHSSCGRRRAHGWPGDGKSWERGRRRIRPERGTLAAMLGSSEERGRGRERGIARAGLGLGPIGQTTHAGFGGRAKMSRKICLTKPLTGGNRTSSFFLSSRDI